MSSWLRLVPDEKLKLDKQVSKVLNSSLTLQKTKIELPTKSYVDSSWNDPSIIRSIAHVDFNDKNLHRVRFVKVNSMPAVREHLTPKFLVDQAISYWLDELSFLRLDPDEKINLHEQDSIVLNSSLTSPKTIIELPTESYVDSLHKIIRCRRDILSVFNDQSSELDIKKLTNIYSVKVNREPISDGELSTENYIDDSIEEGLVFRFIQTLEKFLNVSVRNDI